MSETGPRVVEEQDSRAYIECSFCGKERHDVRLMFTGTKGNICKDCIDICVEVLLERDAYS